MPYTKITIDPTKIPELKDRLTAKCEMGLFEVHNKIYPYDPKQKKRIEDVKRGVPIITGKAFELRRNPNLTAANYDTIESKTIEALLAKISPNPITRWFLTRMIYQGVFTQGNFMPELELAADNLFTTTQTFLNTIIDKDPKNENNAIIKIITYIYDIFNPQDTFDIDRIEKEITDGKYNNKPPLLVFETKYKITPTTTPIDEGAAVAATQMQDAIKLEVISHDCYARDRDPAGFIRGEIIEHPAFKMADGRSLLTFNPIKETATDAIKIEKISDDFSKLPFFNDKYPKLDFLQIQKQIEGLLQVTESLALFPDRQNEEEKNLCELVTKLLTYDEIEIDTDFFVNLEKALALEIKIRHHDSNALLDSPGYKALFGTPEVKKTSPVAEPEELAIDSDIEAEEPHPPKISEEQIRAATIPPSRRLNLSSHPMRASHAPKENAPRENVPKGEDPLSNI